MYAEWDDSYSIGVDQIDQQHKRLFELINNLFIGIKTQDSSNAVEIALSGLVEYTQEHFATEEGLMDKHSYPGARAHAAEHSHLLRTIEAYIQKMQSGEPVSGMSLLTQLVEWLHSHMGATDTELGSFLNSKGIN